MQFLLFDNLILKSQKQNPDEKNFNIRSTSAAPFVNSEIDDEQRVLNINEIKDNSELMAEKENVKYKDVNSLTDLNDMKIGSEDEDDFFDKKEVKDCQEIKVRNHEVNNYYLYRIMQQTVIAHNNEITV